MRLPHQGSAVTRRRQSAEVFQSSCTSWSSKIIAVGMTENSQRTSGSLQASRYRAQYSSKSAISPSGAALTGGTATGGTATGGALLDGALLAGALLAGALLAGALPGRVPGGCGRA